MIRKPPRPSRAKRNASPYFLGVQDALNYGESYNPYRAGTPERDRYEIGFHHAKTGQPLAPLPGETLNQPPSAQIAQKRPPRMPQDARSRPRKASAPPKTSQRGRTLTARQKYHARTVARHAEEFITAAIEAAGLPRVTDHGQHQLDTYGWLELARAAQLTKFPPPPPPTFDEPPFESGSHGRPPV